MTRAALSVNLAGAASRRVALQRVERFAATLPADAWVSGSGWDNEGWSDDTRFLTRQELDVAGGGRAVLLTRKDGHSACLSSAALRRVGFARESADPAGGVIDRDAAGDPTGMVREQACNIATRSIPEPEQSRMDAGLASVLRKLARLGLTTVHTMDGPRLFESLQRLRAAERLPIRVVWNLPAASLDSAIGLGVSSGLGDAWLRVWGVKVFLDGSLGSRTAEMLDGSGTVVVPQPELTDLVARCARSRLNVCMHAIGDAAVRRALDAVEPHRGTWPKWRPRIEHAQCVDPADVARFAAIGVIASMQPVHAVSDRALADAEWGGRARHAYAWGSLGRAGATLAFGSDAPVEHPSPLDGIRAASRWRTEANWYPELALSRAAAIRAYTSGVAYAAGMERETGALRPGMRCDLTIVDGEELVATVVGGRVVG